MTKPVRPRRQTHSGYEANRRSAGDSDVTQRRPSGEVIAPRRGARPAAPPQPKGGGGQTLTDPGRVVTYSMQELDVGPQAGGAIPEAIKAGAPETATLVPGQLTGPRVAAAVQKRSKTPLSNMTTMLHDTASPREAKDTQSQLVPPTQAQLLAAAAMMAGQGDIGRHPAVQRMPQGEVTVDVRDVELTSPDPRLVLHHNPDSEQAAVYRVLSHRITQGAGTRTVLITSAEPRDGKTTCAINLAFALSECGRATVLLVEANLRRPGISRALGFRPPVCFQQQMEAHREAPMSPWTLARVTSWLHVAAVDGTSFQQSQLIDALAIELAVEHFKRLPYDFILIDTPAVLGQADVSLMHSCAEGIVFTAIARESSGAAIRRASQQLAPAHILGIALLEG